MSKFPDKPPIFSVRSVGQNWVSSPPLPSLHHSEKLFFTPQIYVGKHICLFGDLFPFVEIVLTSVRVTHYEQGVC